jgi:hypothetical protein
MNFGTNTTPDTLPLTPKSSNATNIFCLRVIRNDNNIILTRDGGITGLTSFSGASLKSWRILRYNSLTYTGQNFRDGVVLDSACFTKTSMNERLLLHYRFSAYASTNSVIHWTYYYIFSADSVYTGLNEYSGAQYTGTNFSQRMYHTGTVALNDSLPIGQYFIRMTLPSTLRTDLNDECMLHIQSTIAG